MSTPTIDVNLRHCACTTGTTKEWAECSGHPVLIPCPIPRSVTVEVRLGECACFKRNYVAHDKDRLGHADYCPARSVRVSCSISRKTWEESEVGECEVRSEGLEFSPADVLRACRERWALVKALVAGGLRPASGGTLVEQRDAVYSALADMARAETSSFSAQHRLLALITPARLPDGARVSAMVHRPSVAFLAAYVEHLIEQVWVLP